MAVTVPSFIPTPFASEGQFAVIPEVPSSEQGRASWQQGFPQVCAQPLASGGIPPNYQDFQGIFNALSAAICYMQTGALWPWSASLTYPLGAHVLGSDNQEYVALQESTGKDPTTDTTQTYWEPGITASSVFTPPTASEPGKAGLVPQPQATNPTVQLANILTMQGWGSFSPAFVQVSPMNSKELVPSMQVLPSPADLNSVIPGVYYSSGWTNVPDGAVAQGRTWVYASKNSDGTYGYSQIYIDDAGNSWFRGSIDSSSTGEFPVWNLWAALGAPKPKAAEGVGLWVTLGTVQGTGASITLPAGGVWAYFLTGASASGNITGTKAGVAGGNTVVTITDVTVPVSFVWGFCYRVA